MTNAFTAKPKTDTEWLKKANASARLPRVLTVHFLLEIIMENMEIVFCVIDGLDHNDRLYVAKCGDHQFESVAQYWDGETGKFTGTNPEAYQMHNGPKNPDDTAQWFTESPAWDFSRPPPVLPRRPF